MEQEREAAREGECVRGGEIGEASEREEGGGKE